MGYRTIEYSGGIRPSQTTTAFERKFGMKTQPGQRIGAGQITLRDADAQLFIREMRFMGYGKVQRSYGAYAGGQPTQKSQILMGISAQRKFEIEKQKQLTQQEAIKKTDVQFQGPVRPGIDEQTFRQTGRSISQQRSFLDVTKDPYQIDQRKTKITPKPSQVYQGPVPKGASEQEFRKTGAIVPIPKTGFQQKVEQQIIATPIGKPTQEVKKPWYTTAWHETSDFLSGIAGGVWLEHLGRPTTRTAPELKAQFKRDVEKSTKHLQKIGPFILGGPQILIAHTKFIAASQDTAREIRREGELVQAQQKQQIEAVEKSTKAIEELQKEFGPTYKKKTQEYSKDIKILEAEIEAFNIVYGKRELGPGQYGAALEKQAGLTAKQKELITQQKGLQAKYDVYEKELLKEVQSLRKIGVKTEVTPEGEMAFTSKALKTELAPVGMKLQVSYLTPEGKITWKNIALGSGAVARATGEAFILGAAVGGTGVLAKVGKVIAKLPKGVKIGTYTVAGGLAAVGTGAKAYQGYIYGERVGVGKIGAVVGGATAIGQLGGFVAGGYVGTKAYYHRMEKNILSGKYTRATKKMIRKGYTLEKQAERDIQIKGRAGQKVAYETKIKGTKYKIQTDAQLMGKYTGRKGQSVVEIKSKLIGKKVPKGMAKKWETFGETLESKKYVKARLFTKSSKQKLWQQQDVLIKRQFMDKLKIKFDEPRILVSAKTGKSLTVKEAEIFKFKSDIRLLGPTTKVKRIPHDIWTKGEAWRFKELGSLRKGEAAVIRLSQRRIGTPELQELTKQVVLYSPKIKRGPITYRSFRSVGKAGGISDKFLKDLIAKEIAKTKIGKITKIFKLDTKGQVLLQRPAPILKRPTIPLKMGDTSVLSQQALIKAALKGQLKAITPGLLAKELTITTPGAIAVSVSALGLKNILSTRAATLSALRTEQISSLKTDMILKQATKMAQATITQPILMQQVITPQVSQIAIPTITTPSFVMPTIATVPLIPIIPPLPGLPRGFRQRTPRGPKKKVKEAGIYVEGFTAKTLGLDAVKKSQAQAKALLKKVLTGLEIRRRVLVTPNKKTKRRRKK